METLKITQKLHRELLVKSYPVVKKISKFIVVTDQSTPLLENLAVRALDSKSWVPVFKTTGWLQGRLSLPYFRGRSNEYQEFLGT